MKIGVCGMGRMGSAIAGRLLSVGHQITVWNRDTAKTAPLVEKGATMAPTPAALVEQVECAITMLLNADAINAVYRGTNCILSADLRGKLIIDMSTVLPEVEEGLARDVKARGGGFVDCPVGGTVAPAQEGKLLGLAGGSDEDFAAARPILEQLCRRLEHLGPAGSGAKMKLAVNLPLIIYWQALGEALSLVKSLQVPPERLIDILCDTSGTPTAMKGRGPAIAKLLAGQAAQPPSFELSAAKKDLVTMIAYATELGVQLPVTEAANACYDEAEKAGLAHADPISLPVFWSQRGSA